jgi:hypothetical protein
MLRYLGAFSPYLIWMICLEDSIVRFFTKVALSLMFSPVLTVAQGLPSLTPEQWTRDLRYLANEIRTEHPQRQAAAADPGKKILSQAGS